MTNETVAARIVRHPVLVADDFLHPREAEALLVRVIGLEAAYKPSGVADRNAEYRRSLVLEPPVDVARRMVEHIREILPDVLTQVRVPPFYVGEIECQVTASNDGSYFRVHTDASKADMKRVFTYVYYLHRMPKGFTGGELRVYDDQIRNGRFARVDSCQFIEPRHNRIVFFNAAVMHEVAPVIVPSGRFVDSRFTVNGWVQRSG